MKSVPVFLSMFLLAWTGCFVPETKYVIDDAQLLPNEGVLLLNQRSSAHDQTTGQPIIVWTTFNDGGDHQGLAEEMLASIHATQEKQDRAVLISACRESQTVVVVCGKKSRTVLHDSLSERWIHQVVAPAFNAGESYQGLRMLQDSIMQLFDPKTPT